MTSVSENQTWKNTTRYAHGSGPGRFVFLVLARPVGWTAAGGPLCRRGITRVPGGNVTCPPTHTHTHRHMYTHADTETHVHTDTCTQRPQTCTQTQTRAHTQTHVHTDRHVHTDTHTCMHTQRHMHTCAHRRVHTQRHTRTHAHVRAHSSGCRPERVGREAWSGLRAGPCGARAAVLVTAVFL